MVCGTPQSKDAFTHQMWKSYIKEYWRYAPDSIPILLARSDFKATVTQGWYVTLRHPMNHAHTKFGIPTSIDMRYMLRTRLFYKISQCHSDTKVVRDDLREMRFPTIWHFDKCRL